MKSYLFAVLTAGVLTSASLAGAPMHRMAQAEPAYEIQLDGKLIAGKPLYLRLVDKTSGQAVEGGEVAVLRPVYAGPKTPIRYEVQALPHDAQGRFVCASEHHAAGVTLRGAGPAGVSPVWISIHS
ncbi:hypothetical protein FHS83_002979 [Rhizomicrobium palustre]|uniref:Uncharacterized protein n=1 Tax=Rhizomicrobium palustre TaxID=189966 RepID=A0A846N2Z8_9PROT|nr:hypothetical protein [Rhizomicrobium palustre]NIK89661.1 hypothetical protein [Rhizomicrobium palustre]